MDDDHRQQGWEDAMVDILVEFLEAAVHSLLHARRLYPPGLKMGLLRLSHSRACRFAFVSLSLLRPSVYSPLEFHGVWGHFEFYAASSLYKSTCTYIASLLRPL